jgi:hypothetical protein
MVPTLRHRERVVGRFSSVQPAQPNRIGGSRIFDHKNGKSSKRITTEADHERLAAMLTGDRG